MAQTLTVAELISRAVIAVSGPDWKAFLQGLLTQDVETLGPGEIRFAALLTPQGRLLYDLFVIGRDDGAWLDVAREHRAAIIARLSMYRLRAKVEIVANDAAVHVAFPAHPGETVDSSGVWVQDPRLSGLGWRGYGADVSDAAEETAYDAHRLGLGVPGPADWGSDSAYPIEADFDLLNGIDFHKGCFVGQETTSRMKRRGVIKSRMAPVTFAGPSPAPGAEILAGTLRAGEILSGQEGQAMALLRLDRALAADLTVHGRPVRAVLPDWMPLPKDNP